MSRLPVAARASRRRLRRRRRGVTLLEYCLVLPFFLFTLMVTVDVAQLLMLRAAAADGAYAAATAAAAIGGSPPVAASTSGQPDDVVTVAFDRDLKNVPGAYQLRDRSNRQLTTRVSGSAAPAVCDRSDPYVDVSVTYHAKLITPGAAAFFGLFQGTPGSLVSTAGARVRCEVIP